MKQAMSSPMTPQQMSEIVKSVKPGDEIEIVFANKTFNGDLRGRLYMFLGMNGRSFEFGDLQMLNIRAVADTGK